MSFSELYKTFGLCNCGHDYEDHMTDQYDYVAVDEYCDEHAQDDGCSGTYEDQYVGETEDNCHAPSCECPYFQKMTNLEYVAWLGKQNQQKKL